MVRKVRTYKGLLVKPEDVEVLSRVAMRQRSWIVWYFEDQTTGLWVKADDIRVAINYIPGDIDVPNEVIDFSGAIRRATMLPIPNILSGEMNLGEVSVHLLWLVKQVIYTNISDMSKEYMITHTELSEEWQETIGEAAIYELMNETTRSCLASLVAAMVGFGTFVDMAVKCSSKVLFKYRRFVPGQKDEFVQFYLNEA